MKEVKLGHRPEPGAGRDAVHVAVVAMRAPCLLIRGQRVDKDGWPTTDPSRTPIGIVDPFAEDPDRGAGIVKVGEWFWLCLFPGTTTSLRHVWTHPSFAEEGATRTPGYPGESMAWMQELADRVGMDVEEMLMAGHRYQDTGDWTLVSEFIRDALVAVRKDFWRHFENATGRKIDDDRGDRSNPFICSC